MTDHDETTLHVPNSMPVLEVKPQRAIPTKPQPARGPKPADDGMPPVGTIVLVPAGEGHAPFPALVTAVNGHTLQVVQFAPGQPPQVGQIEL